MLTVWTWTIGVWRIRVTPNVPRCLYRLVKHWREIIRPWNWFLDVGWIYDVMIDDSQWGINFGPIQIRRWTSSAYRHHRMTR